MKAIKYADLGSVSSGTMITEDVFDACIWTLKSLDAKRAKDIQKLWDEAADAGDEEQMSYVLNEDLWDALNEHAAPYCYFGAHEGDGADYGFWPSIDSLEDGVRYGEVLRVNDLNDMPKGYTGTLMEVNDHGNVTLYRCSRGRKRVIWSCV